MTAAFTPHSIIADIQVVVPSNDHNVEGSIGDDGADRVLAALNAAGFVVLPREPTQAMTDSPDYVAGNWSRRNWEAILRSAGLSPQ